jgi:hypothetical protein
LELTELSEEGVVAKWMLPGLIIEVVVRGSGVVQSTLVYSKEEGR